MDRYPDSYRAFDVFWDHIKDGDKKAKISGIAKIS
jgi:hypothetical protein